jgi:hypothetical protein
VRLLRILAWLAGAIVACAALLGVVAVVINWRDAPPSANYLHLRKLIADRPAVAAADNSYVYLLGTSGPPEVDPQQLGERRLVWLESLNHDMSGLDADPLRGSFSFTDAYSAAVKGFFDACNADHPRDCPQAFETAPAPSAWSDIDRTMLERYRHILDHPVWREHVANDVRQPMASFQHVTAGQRLSMLALRGADSATLRMALTRDLAFWRGLLASSDTLIAKMIAVAGLRQHFQFGNLLLRAAAPSATESPIPDGWRFALTRDELSLERVLAGELVQMESAWHPAKGVRFFQTQDISNEFAADYVEFIEAFDVPLSEYPGTAEKWAKRGPRHPFLSRLYDVGGDYMHQLASVSYHTYAQRVAAAEAWRRASLTTAQLRVRGVPAAQVAAELEHAALRNPFDGRPFTWSAAEQAVICLGTEEQSPARRRQVYTY